MKYLTFMAGKRYTTETMGHVIIEVTAKALNFSEKVLGKGHGGQKKAPTVDIGNVPRV